MTKSSLLRSASERKFTPPTEFPAEYVDGDGNKAVILGRGPNEKFPFIGHDAEGYLRAWTELGYFYNGGGSPYDLHDTPKRIPTWHNVYGKWISPAFSSRRDADYSDYKLPSAPTYERTAVYRIERDEDGSNPEIFVEKVEDFKEDV